MPTWSGLLKELADSGKVLGPAVFDITRRKYLALLGKHTGRDVILYATKWTQPGVRPELVSITDEDVQGFMEVLHGLHGPKLDLVIHSPGGSPEATEALALYLRSKYSEIRAFVPYAAMSAATMLACAADTIVMGKHSYLGPIDPQVLVASRYGLQYCPAQAILEQFQMAHKECTGDPRSIGVWLPMLEQYGPALLVQCRNADALSRKLVTEWLTEFMLAGEPGAGKKAKRIAAQLSAHGEHKTHARHLNRDRVRGLGLKVMDLEQDQTLQDLALSVFHATTHTFDGTPAVKIIENHTGRAYIKLDRSQMVGVPQPQPQPPPTQKPSESPQPGDGR